MKGQVKTSGYHLKPMEMFREDTRRFICCVGCVIVIHRLLQRFGTLVSMELSGKSIIGTTNACVQSIGFPGLELLLLNSGLEDPWSSVSAWIPRRFERLQET